MSLPDPIRSRLVHWLRRLQPLWALAMVVLVFSLWIPDLFWGQRNLATVATYVAPLAICCLGMLLVMISGGIDLSVGSAIALSAVVAARILQWSASPWAAVGAGLATGLGLGLINGLGVTWLRLLPFIMTLGTMSIARGLAKGVSGQTMVYPFASGAPDDDWLENSMAIIRQGQHPDPVLHLPAPAVLIAVLLALATALVLARTVFGRHCYAIGSNPATARLCGVPVRWRQITVYALAGAAFGLAGLLEMAQVGGGDPTGAVGRELDVIAAVVIGGASLAGGTGTVLGACAGALAMGILRNGCNLAGVDNYIQDIIIGTIIVVAVASELQGPRLGLALGRLWRWLRSRRTSET